ncbi:MAG: 30S ribosome-binding factor RbfA [Bacilli bacterium]|nr:30S ribosome-binding factor RbfA [Bacilli bacterium]
MSIKIDRLNNTVVEEISQILRTEIKDDRINFVTVTAAKITNDLSFAKIYVTILNDKERDSILKQLNKASNFIERELSKRINIRKMPDITFVYDESIEYATNIENIIESIENNE